MEEVRQRGRMPCPRLQQCLQKNVRCAMRYGIEIARNALKEGHSVEVEMRTFRRETAASPLEEFVWSLDKGETVTIPTDREELYLYIHRFAVMVIGGSGEPAAEQIGPDFSDVLAHATTPDGAIDLRKMEALEGRFGSNGGVGCDVRSGPCSCGAWH